jgi:hypothetical protein
VGTIPSLEYFGDGHGLSSNNVEIFNNTIELRENKMNINQIMQIHSWHLGGMMNVTHDYFDESLYEELGVPKEYITILGFSSCESPKQSVVVFNNVTSEVLIATIGECLYVLTPNNAILDHFVNEIALVDSSELLDLMCTNASKSPDSVMQFDITPEDLASLDELAAKSNLTRNDIIAKALIAQIGYQKRKTVNVRDLPIGTQTNYGKIVGFVDTIDGIIFRTFDEKFTVHQLKELKGSLGLCHPDYQDWITPDTDVPVIEGLHITLSYNGIMFQVLGLVDGYSLSFD